MMIVSPCIVNMKPNPQRKIKDATVAPPKGNARRVRPLPRKTVTPTRDTLR